MNQCGLYIHLPFCETKCGYCDFFSVALKDRPTRPLVQRVVTELQKRTQAPPAPIATVFVGGGTPTVLPVQDLRLLLDVLRSVLADHPVAEFTVEANPGTLDDEKLAALIEAGADRISMGAQSWHPAELAALERLHAPDDIAPGVAAARRHGFARINLDLIFGIPGQSMATWRQSLEQTVALGVDHIACYGLTYEPGTRLTAQRDLGQLRPCDDELEADMYRLAADELAREGYRQYEISNFCRAGGECLHNVNYWRNGAYIGVGPSAAGYVDGRRYKNVANIAAYVRMMDDAGHAVVEEESVTGALLAGETIMMQLRLNDGIDLASLHDRTGIDLLRASGGEVEQLAEGGLLRVSAGRLALTPEGRLVGDYVIGRLFASLTGPSTTPAPATR